MSSNLMASNTNPAFRRMMRYLWDSERSNTDHDNEIVILGKTYDPKVLPTTEDEAVSPHDGYSTRWPTEFMDDVFSRIWMTYRTGFTLIPRAKNGPSTLSLGGILRGSGIDLAGFTSDIGWGCMIRTAQSLLANALINVEFGREWRYQDRPTAEEADIIKWFVDEPQAQFSLHRFVEHGEQYCGKMPGEWFGPSAAASSIKALCDHSGVLQVYISNGSDVYENQVIRQATGGGGAARPSQRRDEEIDEQVEDKSDDQLQESLDKQQDNLDAQEKEVDVQQDQDKKQEFRPILILLGLRLGIDQVNPVYWDSLKNLFTYPQAIGIAGGRPSSSHYFFGYQHDHLFYLDPHLPRPVLKSEDLPDALESVHTTKIRTLQLDEVDPSMLVGFLIKSWADWEDWKARVSNSSCRSVINISPSEPVINCRSSISVNSDQDDDGDFIDVGLAGAAESDSASDLANDSYSGGGNLANNDESPSSSINNLEGSNPSSSTYFIPKEKTSNNGCQPEPAAGSLDDLGTKATAGGGSLDHDVLVASDGSTVACARVRSRDSNAEGYGAPVVIDNDMLSSNNSSYVEASSSSPHNASGRVYDEWEEMS